MQLTRARLHEAASRGLLTAEQGEALWAFLAERERETGRESEPNHERDTPGFRPAHILYYLGGLIAIGAMTLFMTLGWEQFGGVGLLLIASGYAAVALALTEGLLRRRLPLPAGLTGALAVALVPLAVYGLQQVLGLWADDRAYRAYRDFHTHIDWRWLLMELATLAAGALALWRYRLPFLVMPVAVTLWYMSMDITPFLLGGETGGEAGDFFSQQGRRLSTGFGLCMVALAVAVDVRTRGERDFAFWLYLFGVLAFWGGLTSLDSGSELGRLGYAVVNLLLIAVGAALSRRVFAVFGGLGLAIYLGHLSHTVFRDSLLFPVSLSAIGLGVIAAGVAWQRREAAWGARFRAALPAALRARVEQRAG